MLPVRIGLALAALAMIPSSAISTPSLQAVDFAGVEVNVAPCRAALGAAYSPRRDLAHLDRFIADRRLSAADEQVQRVLCAAYTLGAVDMAEGLIVPLDYE